LKNAFQKRGLYGEQKIARFYAPQTKIWEGGTNQEQKMKSGFSTDFSMVRSPNRVLTHLKKASFENPDFLFCSSFQNLRLGGIKLLQKMVASQKNQHVTCCYYLLYHLAKFMLPKPAVGN
jgi:hypothetical protein